MMAFYHQTKIPISFLCKRRLNLKYFIQPSETLPVKLAETHLLYIILVFFFFFLRKLYIILVDLKRYIYFYRLELNFTLHCGWRTLT